MRALALLAVSLLSGGASSCGRCDHGCGRSSSAPPAPSGASSSSSALSTRCVPFAAPQVVGAAPGAVVTDAPSDEEAPVAYGAELGGAASEASAFVLGMRSAGLTGSAQLVRFSHTGGPPTFTNLPATGAPHAPLVASRNGMTVVATMSIADKSRVFHLSRLDASGALTKLADIPQAKDESELTALVPTPSGAIVAWDDVHSGRGVIRLVSTSLSTTTGVTDAGTKGDAGEDSASPSSSDAAWPALIPTPDGAHAVLLWLAERPEDRDNDAAGEPSQSEAFRWVEGVVIDLATAKPISAARALTPASGHAQTFAAAWSDGVVIAVRDDPRPTDGDGGELHAYRATLSPSDASFALGEPSHVVIAERDVAPGVAFVLPRPGGALVSYLAHDGSARLVPAFIEGTATTEPALRGRRIVATHERRHLTTRLAGSGLELLLVDCN